MRRCRGEHRARRAGREVDHHVSGDRRIGSDIPHDLRDRSGDHWSASSSRRLSELEDSNRHSIALGQAAVRELERPDPGICGAGLSAQSAVDYRNGSEIRHHRLRRVHSNGCRGVFRVGNIAGPARERVSGRGRDRKANRASGVIEPARGHRDGATAGRRYVRGQLVLRIEGRGVRGCCAWHGDVMGRSSTIRPFAEDIPSSGCPSLWRGRPDGETAANGVLTAEGRDLRCTSQRNRPTRRQSLESHGGNLAAGQNKVFNLGRPVVGPLRWLILLGVVVSAIVDWIDGEGGASVPGRCRLRSVAGIEQSFITQGAGSVTGSPAGCILAREGLRTGEVIPNGDVARPIRSDAWNETEVRSVWLKAPFLIHK